MKTNWYALICTAILWSTKLIKIRQISMHQYAPRSYKIGNRGLKYTSCLVKTVQMTTVRTKPFFYKNIRHCGICNVLQYGSCRIIRHTVAQIGQRNAITWYAPVCTSMHRYEAVCIAVLWSTKFIKIREIGMHQYALVCPTKLRNWQLRFEIYNLLSKDG